MLSISQNKLGKGTYGVVCSGFLGDKPVAIKLINLINTNSELVNAECSIQKQLKHNNIVELFETIQRNKELYLAMELMELGDLHAVIYKHNIALNSSHHASIAKNIADGLHYLHNQGFLHRDIKPHNILFDVNMQAKISDFGMAIKISEAKNVSFYGTKLYTSPEIATSIIRGQKRHNYTPATDVYAFGLTLLEMMRIAPPYQVQYYYTDMYFFDIIANGNHERIPKDTPGEFADLLSGCLKRFPEERLGTEEITQRLSTYVATSECKVTFSDLLNKIIKGDLLPIKIFFALYSELYNQINQISDKGYAPIHYATYHGHIDIVRYLIEKGADLDAVTPAATDKYKNLNYPEMKAIDIALDLPANKRDSIVHFLIRQGAIVSPYVKGKFHAIHLAAKTGEIDIVKKLIDLNPEWVHASDEHKRTPLIWAVFKNHVEVVELLIAHGADVNVAQEFNYPALDLAIQRGHTDIFEILIKAGAVATRVHDRANDRTLYNFIKDGNLKCVQMLVKHNKNLLNLYNSGAGTPLHFAVYNEKLAIISFLIAAGADIHKGVIHNIHDKPCNFTPLDRAILKNNHDSITILIKAGAYTDNVGSISTLPKILRTMIKNGNVDSMEILLKNYNYLLHQHDKHGYAPLHYAVINNRIEVIHFLITQGIDLTATTRETCAIYPRMTAMDIATQCNHYEIANLLREKAPPNDITDQEMAYSAFGQGSNRAKESKNRRPHNMHMFYQNSRPNENTYFQTYNTFGL